MKKIIVSSLLATVVLFSCKNQEKKETIDQEPVADQVVTQKGATYAELSTAEGGEWKGRVYEGGTSFKNVEELWVPQQHTDHSWYLRYEGPGWESSKVGYRLYLDWRNAIDIFGKVTDQMILDQVGQDNFDSYHEEQPWGQDILKVGKALGIGSYGQLVKDSVYHFQKVDSTYAKVFNGDSSSGVAILYKGWEVTDAKTDLQVRFEIASDSRLTKATLQPSTALNGLVTGIVKFDDVSLIKSDGEGDWAYIATYGEQTLVPDELGMVIFYKKSEVNTIVDGSYDHLIHFKPTTEGVTYYFGAAWVKEKDGITNEADFKTYIEEELAKLNG